MPIAETKKYYWLKLQKDFFQQDDMQFLEILPEGQAYVLFYLKLLAKSIDKEGVLRYSQKTPYTPAMVAHFTRNDTAFVEQALEVLEERELIERRPDGTIFMCKLEGMVGCETKWAEQKRNQRQRENDPARTLSADCPPEIETESDTEPELYPEKEGELSPFGERKQEQTEEWSASALYVPAGAPPKGVKRRAFGKYQWIRLTDDEYNELVGELGYAECKRCIDYVDEMAQGNGNKNKWKDWAVVIRKCHREGWGLKYQASKTSFKTNNPFREILEQLGEDNT